MSVDAVPTLCGGASPCVSRVWLCICVLFVIDSPSCASHYCFKCSKLFCRAGVLETSREFQDAQAAHFDRGTCTFVDDFDDWLY